jgi:hypothetical protein
MNNQAIFAGTSFEENDAIGTSENIGVLCAFEVRPVAHGVTAMSSHSALPM